MLSKSCIYAIRAIVFIAHHASKERKTGIKEVADALNLPAHYLGKILQKLVKYQIIQSVKGPNGGFFLDPKSKSTALIQIIEVIDGVAFFHNCGLGLAKCSEKHPCPLHDEFKPFRKGLKEIFDKTTIHDLVLKLESGDAYIQRITTI